MRALIVGTLLLASLAPNARAQQVARVEPANWWVGMVHNRVELLVHGPGMARVATRIRYPGVTLVDVHRGESPNYLFVTVDIAADAVAGDVPIEFLVDGEVVAQPARQHQGLVVAAFAQALAGHGHRQQAVGAGQLGVIEAMAQGLPQQPAQ